LKSPKNKIKKGEKGIILNTSNLVDIYINIKNEFSQDFIQAYRPNMPLKLNS
jgi:hypothetical protein